MIRIQIIGHLGHDPRIAQLPSGDPVLNLSVAAKRYRKGQSEDYWWDVTMFGERGLKLHDMLRKGSHVYVEGEYGERQYTDKQGQERTQREILARDIQLLDKRERGEETPRTSRPLPNNQNQGSGYGQRSFGGQHRESSGQQRFGTGSYAPQKPPPQDEPPPFTDDDIPF